MKNVENVGDVFWVTVCTLAVHNTINNKFELMRCATQVVNYTLPKPWQSFSAMYRRLLKSSNSQATGNQMVKPHVEECSRVPSLPQQKFTDTVPLPQQKFTDSGLSDGCSLLTIMAGAGNPMGGISLAPVQNSSTSWRLMP